MQLLLMVFNGLGWALELVLFVLDLNYWLVSSIVSLLLWTIHFIFSLPGTLTMGLLQLWEWLLGSGARLGESTCSLVLGTIQSTGDIIRGGLAGLDSLKLVWNLLCHLLLRSRELMHRGLLNVVVSAQTLNRQVWEILSITCSLAAYLVNSLINVCLITTQNILSAALSVWISLGNVILLGMEMVAAFVSQLSSSAVAVAILLWTPCQLTLDFIASLSRGVGIIFFRNLYEVLLLLFLIWISRLLIRPPPAIQRFYVRTSQLYRMVLVFVHALLNSEVWGRAAARSLQLVRVFRAAWDRNWNLRGTRIQNPPVRPARAQQNPAPIRAQQQQNPPLRPALFQYPMPNRIQNPQPEASIPRCTTSSTPEREGSSQDPWKLLKQQEESKKCVICQDENKTVLLLPCRHLCLCSPCTEILLQQPIHQRNCPLCRHMILQTLNVYI
ncbi:E3 ubiquitin-protein ligase RNF26 [Rhinophrynus dorsalis]